MSKKILFITGTRADYGKMKPLMKAMEVNDRFEVFVFVCGMHLSEKFGCTYTEILKDCYTNIYVAFGLAQSNNSSANMGSTITCLSAYVSSVKPDLIVVHGDRLDALAGAIVGALNNVIVAHIEGGEVSGTIDESIRHAVSKFAHVHFVCTDEAKCRLLQLGEEENRVHVIGSPDIDIMLNSKLPSIEDALKRYNIGFSQYGILMYHPVTTENNVIGNHIKKIVDAIFESGENYIVIYPNNDLGSEVILNEYNRFRESNRFRVFPSIRFEYFLTLLKNSKFIIGNSSAGIRESGIFGVPAIDIGTRQMGRYSTKILSNIQHVSEDDKEVILQCISRVDKYKSTSKVFGDGNSTKRFMDIVQDEHFWNVEIQKRFIDFDEEKND